MTVSGGMKYPLGIRNYEANSEVYGRVCEACGTTGEYHEACGVIWKKLNLFIQTT